ncbi:hypothetical protein ACMA1D_04750 [Streptomyces sp. 796.1]|uniref:hypothetical protein n=1 Tax=Streptomyces sp. 796.1 TaxID=3163029 RepID=UPI0039C994BB
MPLYRRLARLGPVAVTLAAVAGLFGTIVVTTSAAPPAQPPRTGPPAERADATPGTPAGPHRAPATRGTPHRAATSDTPGGERDRPYSAP